MSTLDLIVAHTVRDANVLVCPLCQHVVEVPPVPVSDALGAVFGMSGDTLARVHGDQVLAGAQRAMRTHLERHTVEEWLAALSAARDVKSCAMCGRPRTPLDPDYDPVQLLIGQQPGWSSSDDGEVCGQCMARLTRGQL